MSKEYFYSRNICCSEITEHPDHYLAKFVICDFSVNGNQVALNRDTIESWMSTLVGNPLVGKLVVAPKGELDFSGHNMKVVTRKDDDGNEYKTAEFDTDAFGSFQSVGIEKIDDTDFIVASCKIWKRYPKACATILRRIESGTLNTSWEIDVLKAHKGIVGGRMAKIIDDGVFTAHCLLGANVEPAYKCSKLLEVAETDFGLELANAYIEDTKEISNIESNEKEAKNLELNKDKETQTAQVEPTEPEQAEQAPAGEPETAPATEPTTPAEPDVQTSEEGGETPPPTEPETGTEPAGKPEPTPETSSLTGRDLYSVAEDAMKQALNSSGSAMRENQTYMDSLQAKLNQLDSTFQKFSTDLMKSDIPKFFVSLATVFVDGADSAVKFAGALPTLTAAISGVLSVMQMSGKLKNGAGKVNMPSYICCV